MGEKVKTATNFANMLKLSPIKVFSVSETVVSTIQTDQPQTATARGPLTCLDILSAPRDDTSNRCRIEPPERC